MNFQTYLSTLTEAKAELDIDSLVKTINRMTERNDHTGSVMKLAEFLKAKQHIKILTGIKMMQDGYGHMPSQLSELREYERKELMKQVEDEYGKVVADKINSAF